MFERERKRRVCAQKKILNAIRSFAVVKVRRERGGLVSVTAEKRDPQFKITHTKRAERGVCAVPEGAFRAPFHEQEGICCVVVDSSHWKSDVDKILFAKVLASEYFVNAKILEDIDFY
jgi:hypothetical protein